MTTILGAILLAAFLAIVGGIALCSHFDREHLGADDEVHP
jgi:hypothetical protein